MSYELKKVPAKTPADEEAIRQHAFNLAAVRNVASTSGLRAGLSDLHKQSGGKFKYQISEIFSIDKPLLLVSTNINVINGSGAIPGLLTITVERNGSITAYGDNYIEGPHEQINAKDDATRVVAFVKKKASKSGLIR